MGEQWAHGMSKWEFSDLLAADGRGRHHDIDGWPALHAAAIPAFQLLQLVRRSSDTASASDRLKFIMIPVEFLPGSAARVRSVPHASGGRCVAAFTIERRLSSGRLFRIRAYY